MKLIALALAGLAAIVGAAVVVAPASSDTAPVGFLQQRDIVRAMIGTFRFHSVAAAEAAGYKPASPCVASPDGGMGIHYENEALLNDPAIDAAKPEVLVYEPTPSGLRLVALEYFRRAGDQTPPVDDSDKPSLFGIPFDGPMPGHAPWHGWHYDLHVWVWKYNPSGLFAMFNPRVSCPA
jgi:hypothetical protein